MFQGMTIGEQRTLLALVVVITLGLAYQAYRQSHSLSSVYVERGDETTAAGARPGTPASLARGSTPAPAAAPSVPTSPIAPPAATAPPPAANAPIAPLPPGAAPVGAAADSGLLDVNTATQEQLEELPGIGAVKAKEIVTYRSAHGPFRSVDRLGDVPGIGEKTLQAIRPLVCVGP
ncbi:MAG: helix-hairpin-helix domain-containing protein [Candidatus Sumerlaeota bacterium]|nr:helix-hairpin-helix domain-containing protein [Candidatus Sumerlaeota bacterium]